MDFTKKLHWYLFGFAFFAFFIFTYFFTFSQRVLERNISSVQSLQYLEYGPVIRYENPVTNAVKKTSLTIGVMNASKFYEDNTFIETNLVTGVKDSLRDNQSPKKEGWKKHGMAQAIKEIGYDIVIVNGIENLKTLDTFNREYLQSKYIPFLINSNSEDRLSSGVLVAKDIGYSLELRSNRERRDFNLGEDHKVFQYDLPILFLKSIEKNPKVELIVVGGELRHRNSEDFSDDKSGRIEKQTEVLYTAKIIGELREEFKDVPIVLTGTIGNFNEEKEELAPLYNLGFDDSLEIAKVKKYQTKVTNAVLEKNNAVKVAADDILWLARTPKNNKLVVNEAGIYYFKTPFGGEKSLPVTAKEYKALASDHFPLFMKISL